MIPMSPDPEIVERRLAHQRDLLRHLDTLGPIDAERLRTEPIVRAATERMMQALVDLALDLNAHVASTVLGRAPATGRESFDLMVEAKVLSPELAARLKPAVGLRNILVHMYADIDVGLVAAAVGELDVFHEYVRAVARWLLSRSP